MEFKDDVFIGNRKYQLINNDDGTVSLVDVTEYIQEGTIINAGVMNEFEKSKLSFIPATLDVALWVSTDDRFKYTFASDLITDQTKVDLIVDLEDLEKASSLLSTTQSFDGYVEIYASEAPAENINGTFYITKVKAVA